MRRRRTPSRGSVRTRFLWIGLGLVSIAALYLFFVYPRSSRLPDPLAAMNRPGLPLPAAAVSLRLTERVRSADRRSPGWEAARAELAGYPYAHVQADSEGGVLQAGLGHLKGGEVEVMESLFAPASTDWSFPVRVPPGGRLRIAMGLLPPIKGPAASARFTVRVEAEGEPEGEDILKRVLTPIPRKARLGFADELWEYLRPDIRGRYGSWERADLDLGRWAGREVRLVLSTRSEESRGPAPLGVWGNPTVLGAAKSPTPPNVLIIMVDAMRPDAMGIYGSRSKATPNMDRLGREGAVFEQARSPSVDTRTSETAFFTGRFPGELGIHYRNRGITGLELRHFEVLAPATLPDRLARSGYQTAAFVNNLFLLEFTGTGYDLGFPEIYNNNRSALDTADLTDRAVRWLAENRARPFFLFMNYNSPHGRYRPPLKNLFDAAGPGEILGYDLRGWYRGSVAYVDEYVGILRQALERLGLLDDTLIVITADHGQVFDPLHDLGVPDRGIRTFNRHGYTLYDEEIHVPLIFRLPGKIPADRRVADPVSLADVFPTLAEAAGAPAPADLPGRSLMPLMQGHSLPQKPVFSEGRFMKSVVFKGWKYIYREPPAARFLQPGPGGDRLVHVREELYDLEKDPGEHRNWAEAADKNPDIASRLRLLRALIRDRIDRDLMLTHLRFSAGEHPREFSGRVSVAAGTGGRIRFYEAVAAPGTAVLEAEGDRALRFVAQTPGGGWSGFFFETDPPGAPVRFDVSMDGRPIDPGNIYGGPVGIPGLIRPDRAVFTPELGFLGSGGGILLNPPIDPRNETGVFVWRTGYLDYVASSEANAGLRSEVRDILLDWGYIQKGDSH